MKKALTILITGGIGSGKSVLSRYLESRGVPVYDSDSRAKALYDSEMGEAVESLFGVCLRDGNGRFDRKALASLVFADRSKLEKLEGIVHPAVLKDFIDWREHVSGGNSWCGYAGNRPFVCMESAIALDKPLFAGSYDVAVMVDADENIRIARACDRDACDAAAIMKRIKNQHLDLSKADYVIYNNGTADELAAEADKVFGEILKHSN